MHTHITIGLNGGEGGQGGQGGGEGGRRGERRAYRIYLGEFEDVLLPVYDLQCSIRHPSPYISRVEPAILIQCLLSLHRLLQVTLEHVGPLEAHLMVNTK